MSVPRLDPVDLVIRADATPRIGAGHVMRTATLAEGWRRVGGGAVYLTGSIELDFVRERLEQVGIATSRSYAELNCSLPEAALLVDTYAHIERERGATLPARLRVLADDLGERIPSGYDVVWNPCPVDDSLYEGFSGSVISGIDAIPIREGLPRWRAQDATDQTAVTLGGGQPTAMLLDALEKVRQRSGRPFLVTNPSMPHVWPRANTSNMWVDFVKCSRLLSAAGSTVWEAAAVGLPVAVVQIAPNQALIADWAARHGAPMVRLEGHSSSEALANAIVDALDKAVSLPSVASGADAVARRLLSLAQVSNPSATGPVTPPRH